MRAGLRKPDRHRLAERGRCLNRSDLAAAFITAGAVIRTPETGRGPDSRTDIALIQERRRASDEVPKTDVAAKHID